LQQILDAAARLFAMKGFHRTTTKEIADAADIAEGTLYNYFESKNDLLFGIMGRLTESQTLSHWITSTPPSNARDFFASTLKLRRQFMDQNAIMLKAIFSEIMADKELSEKYYQQLMKPTVEALEKNLQLRVMMGQIKPIDVAMTARVLAGVINGLFFLEVLGDPLIESEWDSLSETLTDILFEGLSPEQD
jgi:AcrR family transcriptional regulator